MVVSDQKARLADSFSTGLRVRFNAIHFANKDSLFGKILSQSQSSSADPTNIKKL